MIKQYIVDASVLLTLAISEDEKLKKRIANKIKRKDTVLISTLLGKLEISNGLIMKYKNSEIVRKIYERIEGIGITFMSIDDEILEFARQIAVEVGDTIYDSSYHSMAIKYNIPFLTCDKKYFNKAKDYGNIELLS